MPGFKWKQTLLSRVIYDYYTAEHYTDVYKRFGVGRTRVVYGSVPAYGVFWGGGGEGVLTFYKFLRVDRPAVKDQHPDRADYTFNGKSFRFSSVLPMSRGPPEKHSNAHNVRYYPYNIIL